MGPEFVSYDGEKFITYTTRQGLASNTVTCILEDKNQNLWFGTYGGGISKYDGEKFITYTTNQGLANNFISSLMEDRSGNIWIGTANGITLYHNQTFITLTTNQGLITNNVTSLAEDESGTIWIGTNGEGISILSKKEILRLTNHNTTHDKVLLTTFSTSNGLPSNSISAIRFNANNEAIIGTNFGLYILSKKEVQLVLTSTLPENSGTTYNQFNGYPIKDVNTGRNNGCIHIDTHGKLWVGHGNNGVTRVDLDQVNTSIEFPNVEINKVYINGEDVSFNTIVYSTIDEDTNANHSIKHTIFEQQEMLIYGKLLHPEKRSSLSNHFRGITFDSITKNSSIPNNLILPYEYNAISFEFNAVITNRNYLTNYQHKLEGSDKNWQIITKKKTAAYTNLPEGEYIFILKAQNAWGVWSNPTTYNFTISPPFYRTWWAYLLYILLIILSIRLVIKMQTRRLINRQKELEKEVENATNKIRKQKEKIEQSHKEITDSINYAERIQRSFLATEELLNENLHDYFIFFQPKDVVSGDFYWAKKLTNGNFAIVNADSTGHGVPGAIMSILNISSLEKSIDKNLVLPSDIFNNTRQLIIERLKKDGSIDGGSDGMDASMLSFDFKHNLMTYCAAKNPIWIIRENELIEIKGEKMPIGKYSNDHIPFVGGQFKLEKGDIIYTITDGLQDQFGGPRGKKFMVKKLKDHLISISHLPLKMQYKEIQQTFNSWKGTNEQVDDICIIGILI